LPTEDHPLKIYDTIIQELKQETEVEYPLELIPPLLEAFGIGDGNGVFGHAVHLIEKYPNAQELYPVIQQATRSSNPGTRRWCCDILGRRRNRDDEAFLIERLGDKVAEVRRTALLSIGRIAQWYDMEHTISLILPLLQDNNQDVQWYAEQTIEEIRRPKGRIIDK